MLFETLINTFYTQIRLNTRLCTSRIAIKIDTSNMIVPILQIFLIFSEDDSDQIACLKLVCHLIAVIHVTNQFRTNISFHVEFMKVCFLFIAFIFLS